MNRRRFLSGLGAALATVAVTTRLARLPPGLPPYLVNTDTEWFVARVAGVDYNLPMYEPPDEWLTYFDRKQLIEVEEVQHPVVWGTSV